MENRRNFLKKTIGLFSGITLLSGFLPVLTGILHARPGRFISRESLKNMIPQNVDIRKVAITPLKSFMTMGKSDIRVEKDEWRLEIKKDGKTLLKFTYGEILKLPSIEREVLMICPGFFANHGAWKGFSLGSILKERGLDKDIKEVHIYGLNGKKEKHWKAPLKYILNDRFFLAYGVNGKRLPVRNGFPLRLVAQNYYGGYWVKYVNRIELS